MRFENLNLSDEGLRNMCVLKVNEEKECIVCSSMTKYMDFCSEVHICSTECLDKWNTYLVEKCGAMVNGE